MLSHFQLVPPYTAASAALPRLDHLLGYDTGGFFAAAAASEGSLDHFHVYQPNERHQNSAANGDEAEQGEGEGESDSDSNDSKAANDDSNDATASSTSTASSAAAASSAATAAAADDADDAAADNDALPGLRGKGEHTDVGVAIVMTPALLVPANVPGYAMGKQSHEEEKEEHEAFGSRGLTLGGRSPELPPDAVIVMLGEAARSWLPPPPADVMTPTPPIAVPSHEMSLSLSALTGAGAGAVGASRAWFGRMVLPPASAVHPTAPGGITFGAWHDGVNEAFSASAAEGGVGGGGVEARKAAAAAVSCSPRRILADDASCGGAAQVANPAHPGALKPPRFNPCACKVKTWFQSLLFQMGQRVTATLRRREGVLLAVVHGRTHGGVRHGGAVQVANSVGP